jgi:membrane protease YdiL (CAAX protease family)
VSDENSFPPAAGLPASQDSHESQAQQPPPLPLSLPEPVNEPLPPVVQAIRFCGTCGEPWQPEWTECPHCAARRQRVVAPDTFAAEKRAIVSSIALYMALLAVSLVTIAYFLISKAEYTLSVEFIEVSAMVLIVTVWCLFGASRLKEPLRRVPAARWFGVAALCAVPTFIVAHVTVSTLERFISEPAHNYMDPYRAAGFGFGLAVLMVCVQPAIFEELAFRGFIQGSLLHALSEREAILVSAGMFAILHLSVPSIPHLFLIGAVLGWLRVRTGSLYPGMIMHFTHNFLVIVVEHFGSHLL